MTRELIDRLGVIKALDEAKIRTTSEEYDRILDVIGSMPTIEEQIRCKDCIWWTKADASLQGRCSMFGIYPTGTWFCANAERKKGADE